MKLAMTLLVRDEADIVARNIEFHLARGVDTVIAVDNGSEDGTRDILQDYVRAGVAVVIDEPGRDYAQSDWVTRAAHLARDRGADWILNNDADEFWRPRSGDLKQAIRAAAAGGAPVLRAWRRNMMAAPAGIEKRGWDRALVWRVVRPVPRPRLADLSRDPIGVPYFYLDLPPKVIARAEGLDRVAQGNHRAVHAGGAGEIAEVPIDIYHFPVRGAAHFERKILQGGAAYAANSAQPEIAGWHWRRWYRMYHDQGLRAALTDALPDAARRAADAGAGVLIRDTAGIDCLAGTAPQGMAAP